MTAASPTSPNTAPMNLQKSAIGGRYRVLNIDAAQPELQSRLYALGIFPGTAIEVLRRAPLGDPLQLKMGNSLVSIRQHEAQAIQVEAI